MKPDASRRLLLFAAALVLAGCSQNPTISGPTPSSSTSTSSATTQSIAQYYVADTALGFRLFREFREVPVGASPIAAALTFLFNHQPLDPDYQNLWSTDATVNAVSVAGSTATIDLSFTRLNVGAESEARAIDQLVWTATAADTNVTAIKFLRDGKSVESFAGHVDTSGIFKRQASYEVLAPVWITSSEEGQETSAPLTFGGLAQTFEANVQWQVLQSGKVIAQGATTAGEAAPARTPWQVKVTNLKPGTYTIRAFDSSAKDGSLIAEDTKTVKVR